MRARSLLLCVVLFVCVFFNEGERKRVDLFSRGKERKKEFLPVLKNAEQEEFPSLTGKTSSSSSDEQPSSRVERIIIIIIITFSSSSVFLFAKLKRTSFLPSSYAGALSALPPLLLRFLLALAHFAGNQFFLKCDWKRKPTKMVPIAISVQHK